MSRNVVVEGTRERAAFEYGFRDDSNGRSQRGFGRNGTKTISCAGKTD